LGLFARETISLAGRAGLAPPAVLLPVAASAASSSRPGDAAEAPCFPPPSSPSLPAVAAPASEPLFQADAAPLLIAAALNLLDALAARVEAAARNAALRAQKKKELGARAQARLRAQAALSLSRAALQDLLASAGQPDAESFRAAFARSRRSETLRERESAALAALERPAAEEKLPLEALLASLEEDSALFPEEEEVRLQQEIAALESSAAAVAEARGQTRERRAALTGGESAALLRGREAALAAELHALSRRWSVFALAKGLLLAAKQRFEEEGQQGVVRHAGDIFAAITDGEYSGIAANMDGEAFFALHHSGERRDPEKQLSQGTREQLYLALRLAYIKNHAEQAESVPVVMDDILVNFDPVRAANTARVLADFARTNQILFFTCHPSLADLLLTAGEALPGPRPALFTLAKGLLERRPEP
jgi:uncharacterized protein YhaN